MFLKEGISPAMRTIFNLLKTNFMGKSPKWYKRTIIVFLLVNPLIGLSYFKMFKHILPYTIAMTGTGALVVYMVL